MKGPFVEFQQIDIYQFGAWDGDRFVLKVPLTFVDQRGNEHMMRSIDFSKMWGDLPEDVDRDDVVHAMLSTYDIQQLSPGVYSTDADLR